MLFRSTAAVTAEAIRAAKGAGLTVSCDLNYRKKLWKWGRAASEVMLELVRYCDVAIGNEEDAEKVFGIQAPETDVTAGKVEADKYRFVCESLHERFPTLKTIAITLRGSVSASHNTWSAVLWHAGAFHTGRQYDITHIVDRVGGGDGYAAGFFYGLLSGASEQEAVNLGWAHGALLTTFPGDTTMATLEQVRAFARGGSARIQR